MLSESQLPYAQLIGNQLAHAISGCVFRLPFKASLTIFMLIAAGDSGKPVCRYSGSLLKSIQNNIIIDVNSSR